MMAATSLNNSTPTTHLITPRPVPRFTLYTYAFARPGRTLGSEYRQYYSTGPLARNAQLSSHPLQMLTSLLQKICDSTILYVQVDVFLDGDNEFPIRSGQMNAQYIR